MVKRCLKNVIGNAKRIQFVRCSNSANKNVCEGDRLMMTKNSCGRENVQFRKLLNAFGMCGIEDMLMAWEIWSGVVEVKVSDVVIIGEDVVPRHRGWDWLLDWLSKVMEWSGHQRLKLVKLCNPLMPSKWFIPSRYTYQWRT